MYGCFDEMKIGLVTERRVLVVAGAHDEGTLEAVFAFAGEFGAGFILVGDREKIMSISSKTGHEPKAGEVVDAGDAENCAEIAVGLIKEGAGNALMKGMIDTGSLLKRVLDKNTGIRGSGTLSHFAFLEVPEYHKLIGITDGGMIPDPTLEQKAQIAVNTVDYLKKIGYDLPKIAALCASETVNEKIRETVEAALLQEMCEAGEFGECILEGPLSFDIAVSRESADVKNFSSKISGDVDVLLMPNITTGNVLAKGLIYWAGAKMAGCILGAKIPIVLASRGASVEEKVLSIMMSMIS